MPGILLLLLFMGVGYWLGKDHERHRDQSYQEDLHTEFSSYFKNSHEMFARDGNYELAWKTLIYIIKPKGVPTPAAYELDELYQKMELPKKAEKSKVK